MDDVPPENTPLPDLGAITDADVGRWFTTADAAPAASRGAVRLPAWGPDPRGGYGGTSAPGTLTAALDALRGTRPTVLTGAGMSTGSGLPDYRGPRAVPRSPMTIQEFVGSDLARRRYWARSTVGWVSFARARPGPAHLRLAELGRLLGDGTGTGTGTGLGTVITQNVDGLHQAAGSTPVIDLHGRLDTVRCLMCRRAFSRALLHRRLLTMNPEVAAHLDELAADAGQAPDGDAEVDRTSTFRYPPCGVCGGMLKPDVVFFGESAAPDTVRAAFAAIASSPALLVLGSSLTVRSGLRFVRAAADRGAAVVIVNDGPTRGDELATVRVQGRIEDVLGTWIETLRPQSGSDEG